MKRTLGLAAAVAATLLTFASAYAAPTAREQIDSRKFLLGSWSCSFTVGPKSGAYATSWSNVLGDLWLKQTYDMPASQDYPATRAEYLVGYDEGRQAWVRFGAMTTGQYFAIRMTDTGNGGWSWKYTSFFQRRTPETPGSDATFTKKSDSEYAVDGPSYTMDGASVTEHHTCKKA